MLVAISTSSGAVSQTRLSHRIVIADHAPTVREALRWLLDNELDFEVIGEATNSAETLSRAMDLAPDLVIVDIDLPNVGGYTVARMLKQLPQPPLVVLMDITRKHVQSPVQPSSSRQDAAADYDGIIRQGNDWPNIITQIRVLLAQQLLDDNTTHSTESAD